MIQQNAEGLQLEKKNKVEFSLMTDADNRGVLDLINSTYTKGEIEILFSKSPNYLSAMKMTADTIQAVVGKIEDRIEVLGTRSLKKAYINGEETTLGYLSDLRVSQNAKKMNSLSKGFQYIRTLMQDNRAKLHIATIIEDNRHGKIALTWKNKSPDVPNFYDLGLMNTYFLIPVLPKFFKLSSDKINITRGSFNDLDEITEFLNTEGKKKQFFPVYTKEFFLNLPNFNPQDFYIAKKDNKIAGIVAKWDQTPFKQAVIKKYNKKWIFIKRLTGNILPEENETIKQFYVSFITIKDNNNKIFEALLNQVYEDNKHYKYFSLILHENDGLNNSLKKYFTVKYKSRLYITEFSDDNHIKKLVDNRTPYLELAGL